MVTPHYPSPNHRLRFAVLTEGDRFELCPWPGNITTALAQCRMVLAETLAIPLSAVLAEELPRVHGPGFTLTLGTGSPFGYHRITYDTARRWTLCSDPSKPVMAADCAFPLPDAPPFEVVAGACEHIVFIHRRRMNPIRRAGIDPKVFHEDATVALGCQPA